MVVVLIVVVIVFFFGAAEYSKVYGLMCLDKVWGEVRTIV